MITQDLYNSVLLSPCKEEGADELRIISGFATSAMASRHLEDLQQINPSAKISLLVGMCPTDGISLGNHKGFQGLVSDNFKCSYVKEPPAVHGKIYVWYRQNTVIKSFIGSANYTQNAFFARQRETLADFSDNDLLAYLATIERDSIYCDCDGVEDVICVHNDKNYYRQHPHEENVEENQQFDTVGLNSVVVSFLDKDGNVPKHSGINWGWRDDYVRDRNQAYLSLSPPVYQSEFFPAMPQHFTVITDDQKSIICKRASKTTYGGHHVHSIKNSNIGEYFRYRLGVASGAFVIKDDFVRYGRTDVTFYKLDNENYYMDFSVR